MLNIKHKVIAFVPARCGSKSIRNKNILNFCGKPLIYWVLLALNESQKIDEIYLATDCREIAEIAKSFNFSKLMIYNRLSENATDISSTESVMLEFLNKHPFQSEDLFVLVQATSPFTLPLQFSQAVRLFIESNCDSLLSAVKTKRFFWSNEGTPLNYDYKHRPRRQDFIGSFIENGAFYISRVGSVLQSKNRLSGKINVFEMPSFTELEIDEPGDWETAERLMYKNIFPELFCKMKKSVKIFACDVDGVLTDAGMYYSSDGDLLKKFNTHDGKAFELLRKNGIKTAIITSENTEIVARRAEKIKADYLFMGVFNKLEVAEKICDMENISLDEFAYIGDDVNDLELLMETGWACCPTNALSKIKNIPGIWMTSKSGGNGAVRDWADYILETIKEWR